MKINLNLTKYLDIKKDNFLNIYRHNFIFIQIKKGEVMLDKLLNKFFKKSKDSSKYKEYLEMKAGETKEITCKVEELKKFNLGYLIYKGFEVIDVKNIDDKKRIIIKRVTNILKEDKNYSLLIKLPRTGKNGKRIYVYKMRTMQPYSEYLHIAMIKIVGFNGDGTIRNDFRITKVGKFMRKYWLDELPMLLNFLKGDLKIIGVRPLSDAMLSEYPQDFVPYRNRFKPGLIPPYYIDRPKTFDEIIESEKKYLKKYEEKGFITDIIYFFKFLNRVLFDGVRSS